MLRKPIDVFFDANIMIRAGAPPGNDVFRSLEDLVRHGFINVVTTDLVIDEVIRHHTNAAFGNLKSLANRRTRVLASKHLGIDIPALDEKSLSDKVKQSIAVGVSQMYESLRAKVLYIDEIKPSVIFKDYDREEGLFVAKNKKNQFPDAFSFERLKRVASEEHPLLIVADDDDFVAPTKAEDHIDRCGSVVALFAKLGLLVDEPDPNLEPFLYHELMGNPEFLRLVERSNLIVEDEYWVKTVCQDIEFEDITAFEQIGADRSHLVSVRLSVPLIVQWRHLDDSRSRSEQGISSISLYASVTTDEANNPLRVADFRPYRHTLRWSNFVVPFR